MLGKNLKDEYILQLIEDYQVGDVVYGFGRLGEGTEDKYWAEAKMAGLALQFNQNQVLKAVYCYASPIEGFYAHLSKRNWDSFSLVHLRMQRVQRVQLRPPEFVTPQGMLMIICWLCGHLGSDINTLKPGRTTSFAMGSLRW